MSLRKFHHPGIITFIDGDTNQITDEMNASEVPDSIKFVKTENGLIPVIKIISTVAGKQRIIRQYGPEGQFLKSTVQIKEES